jgi:hypothetical protein
VTESALARLSDFTRALFAASAAGDLDACERLLRARGPLVAELVRELSGRAPGSAERAMLDAAGIIDEATAARLAARRDELGEALAQLRGARSAVLASQAASGTRSSLGRA